MIFKENILPWPDRLGLKEPYYIVLDNIEQGVKAKYPDQKCLLIDNTYADLESVKNSVARHDADVVIVISLVDPPYNWNFLAGELTAAFPKKVFRFVGNESYDIPLPFFWMWSRQMFTHYNLQDVSMQSAQYIFLNYNYKPHKHRSQLINLMREHRILDFGYWSLGLMHHKATYPKDPASGIEFNLGPLDIWQNHFLNIVGLTIFRHDSEPLILCEKTIKPLIGLRPFVLNGSPRYYQVLQDLGIDCFEDIFPVKELQILESSMAQTINKCHRIIVQLVKDLSNDNLPALYRKLLPRLHSNRQQFFSATDSWIAKFMHYTVKF